MRKNIKHVLSFMVFTIMTLSLSIVVKAEDKFEIYDTTQDEIQAAIEQGSIEEEYLVGVIDLFNANVHTSSEDLNQLLLESLRQAIDMNSVTDKELQAAREKADLLVTASQEANEYNLNSRTNTVETTYLAGVALVANRGCTQTANYIFPFLRNSFHSQLNSLLLQMYAHHLHIHDIPDTYDFQRMLDIFLIRDLGNVNQSVLK